jgi:asparagine synthase (glutamine-hydrolysing)
MSDVPLGCLLSGGIDSAAITATMSGLMSEPVKTFSVAFAEREANELEFARLVARRFKTDHHEVLLDPATFLDALPRMVWHEDEPIAHLASVALYFVCALAGEHVKVVLTGEGSDETLAGYGRYRTTLLNMALGERYESIVPSAIRTAIRRGVRALPPGSIAQRKLSRSFLALPSDFESLYFDNFAVFSLERQAQLLTPEFRAQITDARPYDHLEAFRVARSDASRLNQLLYVDIRTYLHELLMKQDQMSMAASIESRVPFLDHPLVEFTAQLPEKLKLRGLTTKYILRRSMAGLLPEEILERPKMGFPVPFGQWMRGRFRHVLDEFVIGPRAMARGILHPSAVRSLVAAHVSGKENHAQRLWSLINLEIWQRIHLDGEPIEQIQLTTPAARPVVVAR